MSQSERRGGDLSLALSRRRLFSVAAGLGATALTGCTPSDPRITSDSSSASSPSSLPGSPASPTPAPPPARSSAWASREQELADLAAAILTGPRRADLSSGQRKLVAAVRDAHLQHVAALSSPQPTSRPVSPLPSATPSRAEVARRSLAQSLSLLARNEQRQASRADGAAIDATGFDALLWGSLSVAATSYAAALTAKGQVPTAVTAREHRPMAAMSDVEALQAMVRQLHALVFGYQLALGRLPASGSNGRRALASLGDRRRLRDRLEQELIRRSANVPAAAPAYVPSVKPTTAGRAATLIRQMETALRPFCGLWLASATKIDDRRWALDTLAETDATARSWGASLTAWPGWWQD